MTASPARAPHGIVHRSRPNMLDVLVCGAGPAGSVAALLLARAGARVLVLDRARFPRDKLCGDTVNPGALDILQRLGLASATQSGLPVRGMIVTGEPAVRVEGRYGDGVSGRAIKRAVLDAALLAAAEAAGAQIDQGVVVREPLVESGRVCGVAIAGPDGRSVPIAATLTIAADGAHSRLARALGLARHPRRPRRWAVGAYFEDVDGVGDCGEMHIRRAHYLGVAPLPDGLTNACVVSADRRALSDPAALLDRSIRTDPVLAERFARARRVTLPVMLGPLAVESSACGCHGLLLAGDAAGFIDPMTGDGLRFAFRGAELAAHVALDAADKGLANPHERLRALRQRDFVTKWRFNRALRTLVGSPICVRAASHGAVLAPQVLRHVIRYAGDVSRVAGRPADRDVRVP